jgi:hypothetical protein
MTSFKSLFAFVGVVCAVILSTGYTAVVPASSNTNEGRVFRGTIREDAESGDEVELDHDLKVATDDGATSQGGEVCGYTAYKTGVSPLPFKVVLVDRSVGSAKIVLAPGFQLNYEQKQFYDFDIAADDCVTGAHGPRDHVHVTVEDVNEFSPEWKDQPYVAEVIEGQVQDEILRLDAVDADGSENFSKICQYHLLTSDVPFEITQTGILRNTEPLDYNVKHNFILEVKAEDCGGRLSEKLLVNVLVKPACKTGWQGFAEHIDYETGSGRQALAPNASLLLCDDVACEPTKVVASVRMDTEQTDAATGCEVDTDSIAARSDRCGVSPDTVDLLKSAVPTSSDSGTFVFDGKSVAHDITEDVSFGASSLASRFTFATWMKHEQGDDDEIKQHIVCGADAEGMNRHHFAVYIHNCRLVMLLRQEPGPGVDLNVFKPAEWRWKLTQVCDGAWHHYAINVDFPDVHLYVDGHLFNGDKHNSAIIDDWPLHPTKKVKSTKLVVGACWEGIGHHFGQYLRGELAGLVMINNNTESDQVIQCINSCEEKLDFHAINEMETGMSLSMNSAMSRLSISGHTKDGVEKLVERIGYINGHSKPLSGSSTITMETSLTCKDGREVPIPNVKITVAAAAAVPKYSVSIGGTTQLVREESDVLHGTAVFRDLTILVLPESTKQEIDEIEPEILDASSLTKLDSCTVQVEPQLNEDMEHLRLPESLMKQLGIQSESSAGGLVLNGEGKTVDYTEVLRGIHFVHNRPEDINMRIFRVTCTELKSHFASNQLIVQLSVAHEDPEQPPAVQSSGPAPGHAAVESNKLSHSVAIPNAKINKSPAAVSPTKHNTESAGAGIAVIAIVCIGFLIFLVVLGVARIRSAQRRSVEVSMDEKQEMEWDNSALNITVNPMDRETAYDDSEMNGLQAGMDSDADTDDDIGSFHDEGPDSSEPECGDDDVEMIENGKSKDRDLEWDSSTVTY